MREALHAKKKLVLVHEMDASRDGVEEVGYFFGVTPQVRKKGVSTEHDVVGSYLLIGLVVLSLLR